ncbi:flagellar brake protein [Tepidibacillus fermentans]|uniref:C-di-GMP-binding flagellar brake protein YcgR n=1 Tax=Tepidibacillus fermentans TaxID=1281767 RepID=A0A4R3KK01_9BACI|nr:flagellar brake domain-containing protein [Tepidibacillus fermentans]TCS84121.1 c-di-GMP-binding flagellar brake protein YcgR [Tepidibacillus fermentans]
MLLQINQVVFLSINHKQEFSLKTRIAEINNQYISIEIPINEKTGKIEKIPIGRRISLFYIAKDQGKYMFDTTVIGEKRDQVELLVLEIPKPEQIKQAQRRNFLRVPTSIETSFQLQDDPLKEWFLVKTLDLSGGGMQIIVPAPNKLYQGMKINGWLAIPYIIEDKIEHVQYEAEIVRIMTPAENEKVRWVSIKFTSITETSRAKVIRYCYQRQVQLRKKGII